MKFQFGQYDIFTDVDKNREIYKQLPFVSENCQCDGCVNYQDAIFYAPKEVLSFFKKLGINIQKPSEIYVYSSEAEGTRLFYGGFYHLTGKVMSGKSAWTSYGNDSDGSWWDQSQTYEICERYRVSFQSECNLLEKEFSTSAIQMEIEFHVPWVLEKENQYR